MFLGITCYQMEFSGKKKEVISPKTRGGETKNRCPLIFLYFIWIRYEESSALMGSAGEDIP